MKPVLSAYRVDADEYATVEIAYTPQHAARLASGELGEDPDDLTATRAPEFDQYVPQGHVTPMQLLEHGWWWHCRNCERRTELDHDPEEDELPMNPQEHDGQIYCSDACRAEYLRQNAAQAARNQAARDATLARFPGVEVEQVNAWDVNRPAYVTFVLPGLTRWTGGLGWTVGTDEVVGGPVAVSNYHTYRAQLERAR